MAFDTAASIINDAAVELGLWTSDIADPYASTDSNAIYLCRLLKSLGQKLVRAHPWSQLRKEYTFSTAALTDDYALPADFVRSVDDTHWNRTGTAQLLGPVSPQAWARLRGGTLTAGYTDASFRVSGNLFSVYPQPTGISEYAFEYISDYWVKTVASVGTEPDSDAPAASTDVLWFDRDLLVAGLKYQFRKNRGFDFAAHEEDFRSALAAAIGADSPATVLRLDGGRGEFPLLSWCNVPPGDWGL